MQPYRPLIQRTGNLIWCYKRCKRATNDTNVTENSEIAETLNQHFCSIGKRLASKIPKSKKTFTHFLKSSSPNSMFFNKIDHKEVYSIIADLSSNVTPGLDKITNKVLKISAEAICLPLTHIINKSFEKGIFPDCLKTAKVIPLFKKGDEATCANYRPISVLCNLSKIFDTLIYKRIMSFFQHINVLSDNQFLSFGAISAVPGVK